MTALTGDRVQIRTRDMRQLSLPVAAGALIYAGALVAVRTADAFAQKAATATGLVCVGYANQRADNTDGDDGDVNVVVERDAIRAHNSSGADEITRAHIGRTCYLVDDQTVALTDAGGTRSPAGMVSDVDASGVWIEFLRGDPVAMLASIGVSITATANDNVAISVVGDDDVTRTFNAPLE